MDFQVYYIVSSSFYVVTIIYTLYRLKRVVEINHENNVKKQFEDYVKSDEFRNLLIQAINQSDVNRKLNIIVLALCTNIPDLRKSKICQEGV